MEWMYENQNKIHFGGGVRVKMYVFVLSKQKE